MTNVSMFWIEGRHGPGLFAIDATRPYAAGGGVNVEVICALFIGRPLGADDLHRTRRDVAVVETASC